MRIRTLLGVAGVAATAMAAGRGGSAGPTPSRTTSGIDGTVTLNVDPDLCLGPRHTPFPRETPARRWSRASSRS